MSTVVNQVHYRGDAAVGRCREGQLLGSFRKGGGCAGGLRSPRLAWLGVWLLETLKMDIWHLKYFF